MSSCPVPRQPLCLSTRRTLSGSHEPLVVRRTVNRVCSDVRAFLGASDEHIEVGGSLFPWFVSGRVPINVQIANDSPLPASRCDRSTPAKFHPSAGARASGQWKNYPDSSASVGSWVDA